MDELEFGAARAESGYVGAETARTESSSAEALAHEETAEDTSNEPTGEAQLSQPGSSRVTPHTQPDWLENLKKNFVAEIIEQCSVKTKNAFENNDKIEVGFYRK